MVANGIRPVDLFLTAKSWHWMCILQRQRHELTTKKA